MIIAWAVSSFQDHPKNENQEEEPIDTLLEAKFDAATTRLPGFLTKIDQKTILKFYGLYKQAVEGPADSKKGPYWFETVARKKFNSWLANSQMSRSRAMEAYCELMAQLDTSWDPDAETVKKSGLWEKMPSTMGVIEPEMFDDAVVHPPTKLETETEKKWFAAMRVSDIDTMRTLLRNEPEIIEAKDQYLAMTALLWATDLGCDPVVQFLIENNVDVNAVDGCLQTALHFAAQCHRPLLAELLLQAGADRSALDADGLTPSECCDDEDLRKKLTP
ncbi:Acyl-CoA-binding domain-containing protein 6 [Caenorhabditis elegans]|uniref:Acyl-CoA-binding domain-containing protein 6 n=1 Tax=Caenorhabditis elegans TaxID=6239 RepID=Q9XVJ0_CAEEL|nr:Acyl-CoA-binding domain-containing protein 6 [Caenorhabditis elegans]CAB03343.2 Acyl-CoA-binding domain-containing protein 6 [Caenorhabditis elegans]|eukprot:NP_499817.2 Acyl-Coenzyme A Binding Protein [Caenorhabditis elegans]